jgi:CubicO group peptidase (beta-lactamase class C family)
MNRSPRLGKLSVAALLISQAPAASAQQVPCTGAPGAPASLCATATRLARLVETDSTPAAAVAVVQNGRILWEQGFGEIDRERHVAATPASIFSLASVSKSLTAIAVMHLVEQHRLELDAPVSRYLEPGLQTVHAGSPDSVTIRSLLQMTAGVPHVVRFAWADDADRAPSEAELVRKFGFVAFRPGRHFDYSNMSYGVLQHAATRAARKPFAELLADEIFRPYGMSHSPMTVGPALAPYQAKAYARGSATALPLLALQPEGGAGLSSSAHDLALLAIRLLRSPRPVLSPDGVKTMWRGAIAQPYALGWWRIDVPNGLPTLVADGNATGAAASMVISPERGIAAVVLFNDASAPSLPIAQDIMLALSGPVNTPAPAAASEEPKPPAYFVEQPFRGDSSWAGSWAGMVHVDGDTIPLTLQIDATGAITVALNGMATVPVSNPYLVEDGLLRGRFEGTLPAVDTRAYRSRLEIALRRDDDRLTGHVTATSRADRTHFVLPYFLSLERVGRAATPEAR